MCAIVSAAGVQNAAYYLVGVQYLAFRVTMTPLPSSFRPPSSSSSASPMGGAGARALSQYVVGSVAASVHTVCLLGMPLTLHVAVHHRTLLSALGLAEAALLVCLPALLLLTATKQGPCAAICRVLRSPSSLPHSSTDVLWWTGYPPETIERSRLFFVGA